jgi:hypothetical protein
VVVAEAHLIKPAVLEVLVAVGLVLFTLLLEALALQTEVVAVVVGTLAVLVDQAL